MAPNTNFLVSMFFCDNLVYHENFDNQMRALCVPPRGINKIQHPRASRVKKNVYHSPPAVSSLHNETLQHDTAKCILVQILNSDFNGIFYKYFKQITEKEYGPK